MPFIDSKITMKVSAEKKEAIKSELGQAVSILGKPESFLMVGFDDEYCLYMGGKQLEKGSRAGRLVGSTRQFPHHKPKEQ